jgi:uncharacterized coiled-coil protein SlyX
MWILSFLPDWFLQLVIHGMVIIGLILTFGGNLLKMFPPLATYSVMAKQVGIVVLVIGIYFEGGLANESKWQSRVKELEAKVAVSEEKSKTANAEIAGHYKQQQSAAKQQQILLQERIVKVREQIDAECKVPPEAIKLLNEAAEAVK